MIRVLVAIVGLTAWLTTALGLRAWFGGKAYLAAWFGSEARADLLFERALEYPTADLLGLDPLPLLAVTAFSVSAVLVIVLLLPIDLLLRRLKVGVPVRMIVGALIGVGAAGAVLLSIHPLLSMPEVPEGPRTLLNYACEGAGYGWVNAIAHGGAILTGLGFAFAGRTPDASADAPSPSTDDDAEAAAEAPSESPDAAEQSPA
ncbi:MAG: hypothetical protein AAF799_44525 [Myxococcota bacterium]